MRINAIRLRNVRRFGPEGIALEDLAPGLNVLTAPNEFGKSTLLDALRFAFFVKDSSREQKTAGSLRSHGATDDPFVEVAFEAGGERYRLAKRFAEGRKGSMTRLELLSGGASLLGDDADDRLKALLGADKMQAGPTGLLWVGQGDSLRSIVTQDKTSATREQAETMASLLAGEVSAISGSDDARKVAAAATEALKALETPKNRKATGKLAEAEAIVGALRQRLQAAQARVDRSAKLRDELAAKRAELASLDDPEDAARRRAELAEAEKRAADGERLRSERGHTEELIERDRLEQQRAEERRQELADKVKRLSELRKTAGMAAHALDGLEQDRGMAKKDREAARRKRAAAQEQSAVIREKLDRWQRIDNARRARSERKQLLDNLDAAQQAAKSLVEIEQVASQPPIDLNRLREAEQAVDRAEARLSAASPELTVESGGPVSVDGVEVGAGQGARISGEGRISVAGTVMTLALPGREALREEVQTAKANRDRLFSEMNVTSLSEAQDREDARIRAGAMRDAARRELRRLAPDGIDALRVRIGTLEEGASEGAAPDEGRPELEQALLKAAEAERAAAEEERRLSEILDQLADKRTQAALELEVMRREAAALDADLGDEAEQEASRKKLDEEIAAVESRIGARRLQIEAIEKALRDVKRAEKDVERLRGVEANERRRSESLGKDIVRIETELKGLYADGVEAELAELADELAIAEQRLAKLQERRGALRLIVDLIAEEEETRRETIVAPVMKALDPMLERVFGDARLRFDSEWNPEKLERPGQPEDVRSLSAGTREQIAILTRLAFARLMAERGNPMPVILDDALGYADDSRARKLFGVLHEVAEETQIIVLTCHDRLFRDLGGQGLEPTPFPET
ncbi:AAA family ATPase [Parvularcula lutaonensis]|uniref:AAA family ATPase n=1 Tax=Parvularcula lutaonensis TaxID=491923 RepID=A0ABV7MFY8_9PROT|nr:AAA family ATPase [Parvularcula lutaonensis]GGY51047.1 hypothetical protein GCM10007148_19870 [Parvularcula lutaonensis]